MNEPHTILTPDNPEQDTDLLVVLEDVLLQIDELRRQRADTNEIEPLLAYAASLSAKLP